MIVAVIGGKLQGVEAAYLAGKAGWEVRLVDKKEEMSAAGLCDSFVQADVTHKRELRNAVKGVDLIIPALEDDDALEKLVREADRLDIPLSFDPNAYRISSSKLESNRLFEKTKIPFPVPWPRCPFPVLVKPSDSSGSKAVRVIHSAVEMEQFRKRFLSTGPWVLQEYIHGPTYSLEVFGCGGTAVPLQITDLYMDGTYDCKRVRAPTVLSEKSIRAFENITQKIAGAIDLKGIMDVEMILSNNEYKVLEIDARLPSQTPTAVFWSSGLNMVKILGEMTLAGSLSVPGMGELHGVVYEHIHVSSTSIGTFGEHIMVDAGPLHREQDFFGADEAITNCHSGKDDWVATLIISAPSPGEAWAKREAVIAAISRHFGVERLKNSSILAKD